MEGFAGLGADLESLLRERAAPLVRCECISRHGATRETRETFRLDFGDGVTLKGRRVRSPAIAGRVRDIVGRLDPERFPRVLACRGTALLEEWIPGETIEASPSRPEYLRWAAETLGAVHRLPVHGPAADRWLRARLTVLSRHLERLAAARVLPAAEARRLKDLAAAHAPAWTEFAIIHRDVCPENIVVDGAGRLHCIDNAALRGGAPDEDLARTCYRWPLEGSLRETFLDAYRQGRDPRGFLEHRPFWMVAALSHASFIRHVRGYARPDVPLLRLRAELDDVKARPARARGDAP